jgi:putative tryptophan/tyrosine transport system substrate-binding protein
MVRSMAINIARRKFLATLGGSAFAWPLATFGQQYVMPVIGFLSDATPEAFAHSLTGFRRGLSEMGFTESRNLAIEYRWARGNYDIVPNLAIELIHQRVVVIVTSGSESVTRAAMAATTTIPIVAMVASDPVRRGLVTSVEQPSGNVTVVSVSTFTNNAPVAKRVELAHQLVPKAAIVGWVVGSNILDYDDELNDLQRAAQGLGLEAKVAPVANERDLDGAFASLVEQGAGFILESGPIIFSHRAQVVTLAARASKPVIYEWRDFVNDGGLMSYGTDRAEVARQAGIYAGRLLKGEKVSGLPVAQPAKFEFVLNLKTARALGLTIPDRLLALADEVID